MPNLSHIARLAERLRVLRHSGHPDSGEVSDLDEQRQTTPVQRVAQPSFPVTLVTRERQLINDQLSEEPASTNLHCVNDLCSAETSLTARFGDSEEWKIKYLERAAIRDFDGNKTRTDADVAAWREIVVEKVELDETNWQYA